MLGTFCMGYLRVYAAIFQKKKCGNIPPGAFLKRVCESKNKKCSCAHTQKFIPKNMSNINKSMYSTSATRKVGASVPWPRKNKAMDLGRQRDHTKIKALKRRRKWMNTTAILLRNRSERPVTSPLSPATVLETAKRCKENESEFKRYTQRRRAISATNSHLTSTVSLMRSPSVYYASAKMKFSVWLTRSIGLHHSALQDAIGTTGSPSFSRTSYYIACIV